MSHVEQGCVLVDHHACSAIYCTSGAQSFKRAQEGFDMVCRSYFLYSTTNRCSMTPPDQCNIGFGCNLGVSRSQSVGSCRRSSECSHFWILKKIMDEKERKNCRGECMIVRHKVFGPCSSLVYQRCHRRAIRLNSTRSDSSRDTRPSSQHELDGSQYLGYCAEIMHSSRVSPC